MIEINTEELPWFTVIIPQKNRAEYIGHTIRTCMMQDYPKFEIIVSDDCSDDNSVQVIKELQKIDSRIKLFDHHHHLGMRDNFEFALNQVKQGYVMALGGDDGLLPGCIWKMYEIFVETGKKLLTWPLARFAYPQDSSNKNCLFVLRNHKLGYKIIQSQSFLNKIAKTFNYMIDECPMFYIKGIASTELINCVKSRTPDHNFYNCPTPDGFSGVILAGEVEDYVYNYESLSIGGSSIKSQGQNYYRTDNNSRKESQEFFNDNIRRTMHKDLASQPYSPLITLMTADYLLSAKDLPGWPGKFNMFTFEDLIRKTFAFISNSMYEKDVLTRELLILKNISAQHDIFPLFEHLLISTKIHRRKSIAIFDFAITHTLRFEGSELGIDNIYDASLAVNFISNIYKKYTISKLLKGFYNTIRIVFRSKIYTLNNLPSINDINPKSKNN